MKLTRLDIVRLPGIDPGFTLKSVDPGLNFVTGPNAVGKSSLVRALEFLVTKAQPGDPKDLYLSAEFDNGAHWEVSRNASHQAWYQDGRAAEAGPHLPGRDELHCYWLRVEDLLTADTTRDQALVDEIRQALAGGFDLRALRQGEFEFGPGKGRKEARELWDAERRLAEVEAENRSLQQDEAQRDKLEQEILEARRVANRRDALARALELHQVLVEARQCRSALSVFPKGMDKLRGNEIEVLEKIDQRLAKQRDERNAAESRRADAVGILDATGLSKAIPREPELAAAREIRQSLKDRSQTIERLREELVKAKARVDLERRHLGVEGSDSAVDPDLSIDTLEKAAKLARELRESEIQAERLDARIESAGQAPDTRLIEAHRKAVEALRTWLRTSSSDSRPWLAIVLASLGGVFSAVAALMTAVWWLLAATLLSWAGAAFAWYGTARDKDRSPESTFPSDKIEAPKTWRISEVESRLSDLESAYAALLQVKSRAESAADDAQERKRLQARLDELSQRKLELAGIIGFDPSLTAASVDAFANAVGEWLRASRDLKEIEAVLTKLESDQKAGLGELQGKLEAWIPGVAGGLVDLAAALDDLEDRTRQAMEAKRTIQSTAEDLQRLDRQQSETAAERHELFSSLGLANDDEASLRDLLTQQGEWRERQDTLLVLDRRAEKLRALLGEDPELLVAANSEDPSELQNSLDKAERAGQEVEALLQERSRIDERLRSAGKDRAIEKAMVALGKAREALESQYDRAMFSAATNFLVDEIEAEYKNEHEPVVLGDAREMFRNFTHHQWDLVLDDYDGLVARDLQSRRLKPLSELSSGTRMQLLLAVRMAWTRRLEQRCEPLPLFLDEALTTSDEARFEAVARNLVALARDQGRQVFYLGARRQEYALWEKLTGVKPNLIDLAEVRFKQTTSSPADYESTPMENLPSPGSDTPEEYASRLGVRAYDPSQSIGMLPLFYLLRDDLPTLHLLMQDWRVTTLAQLESLLESNVGATAFPDEQARQRLVGRCRVARSWHSAWKQGRGKLVDRSVLEQSGAVSENFIAAASELADELNGDGAALVNALEERPLNSSAGGSARRLSKAKREQLEEFLRQQGYVTDDDVMNEEQRLRNTVWSATADASPEEIRRVVAWLESAKKFG